MTVARRTAWDRLRSMSDDDRPRKDAVDLLDDLADVRAWADATNELADAIDEARETFDTWADAEGRDEKADARDEVIEALSRLLEAYDAIDGLIPFGEIGA